MTFDKQTASRLTVHAHYVFIVNILYTAVDLLCKHVVQYFNVRTEH